MSSHNNYRKLLTLLALTLLTACSATTDPTKFYTLKPAHSLSTINTFNKKTHSIAIESITISRLLDRPQIVSRIGENEIKRSEFHQWGGSIVEEIEQIIYKQLLKQLETSDYILLPKVSRLRADYNLYIDINRLDGELGDSAVIELHWQIESEKSNEVSNRGLIKRTTNLPSRNYSSYVSTLQQLLEAAIKTVGLDIKSQVIN